MGYAYLMAESENAAPWVIRGWQEQEKAKQVIFNADAVLTANCSDDWVMSRLKAGKLTFRAHERWYRKELPWYRMPRAIFGGWLHHGRFRSVHLLAASAYTPADAAKIGCFRGKAYRWGYFPAFREYSHEQMEDLKHDNRPILLWAGRFIDWKHADDAIAACLRLKGAGYPFQLCIAGSGPDEAKLRCMAEHLGDDVRFLGLKDPDEMRHIMERSDIFLFTSDFQEGWGVVLNEAMNSGCAVVSSHAAGSAPYLVRDGENGLLYPCGDVDALTMRIQKLLDNPQLRHELGWRAYESIRDQWTPEHAANRLVALCQNLLEGFGIPETEGPCSPAPILKNFWYS